MKSHKIITGVLVFASMILGAYSANAGSNFNNTKSFARTEI